MRRTLLVPAAGLALVLAAGLAGCGTGTPTPAPSVTDSASASPEPPVAEPTDDPTTVGSLPGSAFLRVSVTADAGDREVDLTLTFARAAVGTNAPLDFGAVQDACPNAIESQLELMPGAVPVGVITSVLTTDGDWPEGLSFAVSAGGLVASIGEGANIAPSDDPVGMFGCSVPVVTGPGTATFTSLLVGNPAETARANLDIQVAHGRYGFESDSGSNAAVTWKDCIVQLSSAAQRFATENNWVLPADFGDGCLIGDGGSV
jgi:hypothetical protein